MLNYLYENASYDLLQWKYYYPVLFFALYKCFINVNAGWGYIKINTSKALSSS